MINRVNNGMDKMILDLRGNDVDEHAGFGMTGHVLIRDKHNGEILLNKRNAIHYGNMARVTALALNNRAGAYVHYMAFGNGGSSVDTAGKILYKTPRVSASYDSSATLYSRTYYKTISSQSPSSANRIDIIQGPSYTDLKTVCLLSYGEPSDQDAFDTTEDNQGDYVFDELGLFSFPSDESPLTGDAIDTSLMLTHVVFHPVKKALNREYEIFYTIRIQLS